MFTVYCSNQSDPLKFRFLLKERDHQAVTLVNFPRASLVPPAYLDKEELYLEKFALKLVDLPDGFLMENDPIFLFNRIMVILQNPGQINDLTLNSFISGRKCCIHISLSCLLLLLKRILWHVVSPLPRSPPQQIGL